MSLLQSVYTALQQGRPAEAEQHALAWLKASPRDPEAHRAHAAVMQMTGRIDQAILSMRTAVALAPQSVPLRIALGQVLGSAGRIDAAIDTFADATRLQPDAVDAWYLLGTTLYGAQRDAEAADALRRAHALRPAQPEIVRALAEADYALERFAEAASLFETLVPAYSADPMLWLRRSQCLRRDGAAADARRVVDEALSRFPDDARLWLEAGWVQEDLGDAEAAQQAYARAHALQPAWADPVGAALALARKDAPDALVAEAQALIARADVDALQKAFLHYTLGKRSDARRDYADAAMHWSAANRLRRQLEGGFERERYAATVNATISALSRETLAAAHANACADDRPIFVLGMPRSGTTLVEQILAAHPQVHGCGELTGIVRIAEAVPAATGLRWPQNAADVPADWRQAQARAYLDDASRRAPRDAVRLVDKQPYNFLHVGLIAMLFSGARIVWCRRDPRDIALSIFSESFSPLSSFATDIDDIRFVIAQQERLMRHWQAVSPIPLLEMPYETMVADSEAQMRRLVDFAGLPWDDACLRFHESGRMVQTFSRWQVRRPISASSVGRWRNYPQWFPGEDA